jgi:hypothetical protein
MKRLMLTKIFILASTICVSSFAQSGNELAQGTVSTATAQNTHSPKALRKIGIKPKYQLLQDFPYEPLSEICEAFTEMLNSFGSKEPQMRCEQKLNPKFPQFKDIKLQEQPSKDNFKYYSAIRDLANREVINQGFTPWPLQPGDLEKEFQLHERMGGYKYYLVTTDRFLEGRTITLLIQERQGDCRTAAGIDERVSRIAYEWNAETGEIVKKHFAFHSIFTYEGKSLDRNEFLTSYWNEAELSDKPPGKFGSIWVNHANGKGAQSRICTIVFNGKQ